ncbi:MAG: hypothetical protein IKX37_03850 [Bacteroidales bacterium]|nr:hypothetical protein [Bacteroidales bacterium]
MRKLFLFIFAALCLGLIAVSCKKEGTQKYGVDGKTPMPKAVDLGIKVNGKTIKWASFNLGASTPEGYGDFYAWGEMEPKASYTDENYTFKDNPLNLTDAGRDVAREKLGGKWRMPTAEEFDALWDQCTWTEVFSNGVKLIKATGPNKKSILFPYAGYRYDSSFYDYGLYGNCWTSSIHTGNSNLASYLLYSASEVSVKSSSRSLGRTVRPVSD